MKTCFKLLNYQTTQLPNSCYNPTVLKRASITAIFLAILAVGQQEQPPAQQPESKPKVRVNYLNVCSPSDEEQAVLKNALATIPGQPAFTGDFEVARGRVTLKDTPVSRFVRLRREFGPESPLLTAQYSMSLDEKSAVELFVFRMRDPKTFHEIAIEDRVSAGAASPLSLLSVNTPAARVRIERLGKSSVVLARCEGGDQSEYEPIFKQASEIIARYRAALGLRNTFRSDISWLASPDKATDPEHPAPTPHK
jgi:hypothetical protein